MENLVDLTPTPYPADKPIPKGLLVMANKIALDLGHEWSGRIPEGDITIDDIRKSTLAARGENAIGGIVAPTIFLNAEGDLAYYDHTTGTGRTHIQLWDGPDGITADIYIMRPGSDVSCLEAHVGPNGDDHTIIIHGGPRAAQRHLDALEDILFPLYGERANRWLDPYRDQVDPDPQSEDAMRIYHEVIYALHLAKSHLHNLEEVLHGAPSIQQYNFRHLRMGEFDNSALSNLRAALWGVQGALHAIDTI